MTVTFGSFIYYFNSKEIFLIRQNDNLMLKLNKSLTQKSQLNSKSEFSPKHGIVCWECGIEEYKTFSYLANWTYNYRLAPAPDSSYPVEWATAQGVEFVPMMALPVVDLVIDGKCDMRGEKAPLCTIEGIIAAFKSSPTWKSAKYILGWNEPFNKKGDKK